METSSPPTGLKPDPASSLPTNCRRIAAIGSVDSTPRRDPFQRGQTSEGFGSRRVVDRRIPARRRSIDLPSNPNRSDRIRRHRRETDRIRRTRSGSRKAESIALRVEECKGSDRNDQGTSRTRKANMKQDDIVTAICDAPPNGMPTEARKALVRSAVALIHMVFTKATPQLEPPVECSHLVRDVVLAERLLARWGAEEEMKRRESIREGKVEP